MNRRHVGVGAIPSSRGGEYAHTEQFSNSFIPSMSAVSSDSGLSLASRLAVLANLFPLLALLPLLLTGGIVLIFAIGIFVARRDALAMEVQTMYRSIISKPELSFSYV